VSGLPYYAGLLSGADARLESFEAAIAQAVRPGDRVLEVGTGLGTFAFLAARAGAGEVWAVEADPVVEVARELAVANDPDGVIRFARGRVPDQVAPPGPFDVILYEDFPTALLDADTHALLTWLHQRLAPDGRMVPTGARLWLAPTCVDPGAGSAGEARRGALEPLAGLDFALLGPLLANRPRQVSLGEDRLLGEAVPGPALSLLPPPSPSELTVEARWRAPEGGRLDGLLVWFELEVGAGRRVSNAPGPEAGPWGQLLLPVDPPLEVEAGADIGARVGGETREDGTPGWWSWSVRAGGELRRGHEFASLMVSGDELHALRGGEP